MTEYQVIKELVRKARLLAALKATEAALRQLEDELKAELKAGKKKKSNS